LATFIIHPKCETLAPKSDLPHLCKLVRQRLQNSMENIKVVGRCVWALVDAAEFRTEQRGSKLVFVQFAPTPDLTFLHNRRLSLDGQTPADEAVVRNDVWWVNC
jgi:hypothetical protein